jgi:hypothetical protein
MSDRLFERAVIDWLDDGSDRTPRRAIDGVLLAVKTTPQERDLRIPWRFPKMPTLSRATGVAAVALVAAVSVGGLLYLNAKQPGAAGTATPPAPSEAPTTAPTAEPAPTTEPTSGSTPPPTFEPSNPAAWTNYTSTVYGYTISYPSDWSVHAPADHAWQSGEAPGSDDWPWADVFANDEAIDGDSIGLWVWQAPAPTGADLDAWSSLEASFLSVCEIPTFGSCERNSPPTQMCLGQQECQPALIVPMGTEEVVPFGVFGDSETGFLTVFQIGRPDDFPAAARYGGTTALLKAILAQVGVRPPEPGETPH